MRTSTPAAILATLLLVGAPSLSIAETAESRWLKVRPENEGFEVRMPVAPERSVKETSTFAGTVEDVSYRARRGDEVFMATRVDLPGVATFFMSDESLLDSIRDSFLEKGNGTEKSYVDIERDGTKGKKLDFVMKKPHGEQDARAEFFLVDGRMLSFTGIVPRGYAMDDVDRFLASIDILDED